LLLRWLLMTRDRMRADAFCVARESFAFMYGGGLLTQCALPHRMRPALELTLRIERRPGRIAPPCNPQRCE
jgi:hypothetical protein